MSKVAVKSDNRTKQRRKQVSRVDESNRTIVKKENERKEVDIMLVYRLGDKSIGSKIENVKSYLENQLKLQVTQEKSQHSTLGFIRVHAPHKLLINTAATIRIRKILQDKKKSNWLAKQEFRVQPLMDDENIEYYTIVYHRTDEFAQKLRQEKQLKPEFYITPAERIALTYQLINRKAYSNETGNSSDSWLGVQMLVQKEVLTTFYPLHQQLRKDFQKLDDSELNYREKLRKHWANLRVFYMFQPIRLIRSYFGEKVAFYFAFSGFYNMALIPAALLGLIIFIYGAASVESDKPTAEICGSLGENTYMCPRCDKICPFWKLSDSCAYTKASFVFDNTATLVFAILMSFWARGTVEFWKRREATLKFDWDSIDFDTSLEPIRPEYQTIIDERGKEVIDPNTQLEKKRLPFKVKLPGYLASIGFLLGMLITIGATVIGTIMYRVQVDFYLKKTNAKNYSSIIVTVTSAIINLIIVLLLTRFYYWLARWLTSREYHKYQSTFDDAMTIKLYLFQFANYYSTLFYVAFFKGRFLEYPSTYGETGASDFKEQCDPGGCFLELTIQLITIMIGKQLVSNIIEYTSACCAASTCCSSKATLDTTERDILREFELPVITHEILFDEYLEHVIQFGFITLFAVAFPLAPLLALLNNLFELRLDAWKFLTKCRRPIPQKASDIGVWNSILSGISYLSVLTNAAVIAWTSEFIPRLTYTSGYSTTQDLNGYISWTLSSFPINDYNRTGLMYPDVPSGLTHCRYRDFRESVGPSYTISRTYWHVIAARLAFMVAFEHVIFFTVRLIKTLVPDVPKEVKNRLKQQEVDEREKRVRSTLTFERSVVTPGKTVEANSIGNIIKRGRIETTEEK